MRVSELQNQIIWQSIWKKYSISRVFTAWSGPKTR